MEEQLRKRINALVKSEVVPAIGCTEPMAVALCVAKATERLGMLPEKIEVQLSANMLKNAMGVGIPGTGMVGLPIAIALGALVGKSDYQLEVLRDVTPQAVEDGKRYIEEGRISVRLKADAPDKLYIEVHAACGGRQASATILGAHTRFVDDLEEQEPREVREERWIPSLSREEVDPELVKGREETGQVGSSSRTDEWLSMRLVYEFATTAPLEEIAFIGGARTLNEKAAAASLQGNYGHALGKALTRPLGRGVMGDSIFSNILSVTACACDARMAGAMIPVMSNSGSGNQGICATLPVVQFAEENHNTAEELTRALMLSHLTAIYVKQSLGTLSALCGCVVASTGSACGITYLMGGSYEQVTYAVKNMIANLTGMICDGAKPSCALKLASGVSTAVLSAMLAIQGECVSSVEGIIDEGVDQSIHNLTRIGKDAMEETDRCVLSIMTSKGAPRG